MFDSDFVEAFSKLSQKAAEPVRVAVNDDKILVVAGGAILSAETVDPPRRKHIAKDLTAIALFAATVDSSTWYSADGVACLIDDADRRDRIDLQLAWSPQLATLLKWEAGKENVMDQNKAVLVLRTMFRRCLGMCGELIGVMRGLKFATSETGDAMIAQGKASFSKRIDQELTGSGSIPDEVTLQVPIFASGYVCVAPIEVAIHVDCPTKAFHFIPMPGAISKAVEKAEKELGDSLRVMIGESTLYYGRP